MQLGIVIEPTNAFGKNGEFTRYNIFIKEILPGQINVFSPSIRKLINEKQIKKGTKIGHITTELFNDTLTIRDFFPFGRDNSEFFKIFVGKGISSKIKNKTLIHLKKRYPSAKKIWIKSPSKYYKQSLVKMGFKEMILKKGIEINQFQNMVKRKTKNFPKIKR